jgi:hypothetical protein
LVYILDLRILEYFVQIIIENECTHGYFIAARIARPPVNGLRAVAFQHKQPYENGSQNINDDF